MMYYARFIDRQIRERRHVVCVSAGPCFQRMLNGDLFGITPKPPTLRYTNTLTCRSTTQSPWRSRPRRTRAKASWASAKPRRRRRQSPTPESPAAGIPAVDATVDESDPATATDTPDDATAEAAAKAAAEVDAFLHEEEGPVPHRPGRGGAPSATRPAGARAKRPAHTRGRCKTERERAERRSN